MSALEEDASPGPALLVEKLPHAIHKGQQARRDFDERSLEGGPVDFPDADNYLARLGHAAAQIEEVGSAAVQAALSEHVTNVAQFIVSVPVLLTNGVIVLGCLMYLLILSPRVFLVTVPFIVLGSLGYHRAHLRAIRDLRAGAAAQRDRLSRAAHRRGPARN